MTNGSLMQVESIAECSPWSILLYFCLHLAIIGLENQFLVILRMSVLDRFCCMCFIKSTGLLIIPPANFVCRGYTVFTLSVHPSVRASVRPSVTLCFLNNSKSHCWIFIKPCKHVHICKTNTLDKKVRARGQFY